MKRKVIIGCFFILFGFFVGKMLFTKIRIPSFKNDGERYFFLQEGVYYSNDQLKNISQGILEYKDDKIYVYSGITKDLEVAEKIMNIYLDKNIQLNIKEKYLSNEEFKNNVEQFDLLIKSSKDKDEILKIEEVVLANYEEIIKNGEN